MRKHIFNAGPCKLSDRTLENTSKAIIELNNSGQSILEVSHRGKDFDAIMNNTRITSYNVCYTKLLRVVKLNNSFRSIFQSSV